MIIELSLKELKKVADAIREDAPYESGLTDIILDAISATLTRKQFDTFLSYAYSETDDWSFVKDEFRPKP